MITNLLKSLAVSNSNDLLVSTLFNEESFYPSFILDLKHAGHEVIIESPFVTHRRIDLLLPTLEVLKRRGVRIAINTRDPNEHSDYMSSEATESLALLQHLGLQVIYTDNHHRKLAIIDRDILWEGSLNILSHRNSKEIMRRTESSKLAWEMSRFIEIDAYI